MRRPPGAARGRPAGAARPACRRGAAGPPRYLGGIPHAAVFATVGTFAKAYASLLNTTTVHNADALLRLVSSRPPGTPLLTVSNHMVDDPLMWGFKGFPTTDAKLGRWVLTAEDICFKNVFMSYMFRLGLVISTDAGKGIEVAVDDVYPGVEHRECMRHLWKNMKKSFSGTLYGKNMWCAAKSFTISDFNYFMGKIEEKDPKAIEWLDENHPYVWSRSKFSEDSLHMTWKWCCYWKGKGKRFRKGKERRNYWETC